MSYELFVYGRSQVLPERQEVSDLLDLAGWGWALVRDLKTLKPASWEDSPSAVGWEIATETEELIATALENQDPQAVTAVLGNVGPVEIDVDLEFSSDPEVIAEMREAGLESNLVSRAEKARTCFSFRTSAASAESSIDFQWALAPAVSMIIDGVLEDLEEGTLMDSSEED